MEAVLLAARALIITYNSQEVIAECLEALAKVAPTLPVTVFDNASSDLTLDRIGPGPQRVASPVNLGFAGAINQGFRNSSESILLILNPDVSVSTPLEPLFKACEKNGVAAGLLTDQRNRPQTGFSVRALPTALSLTFEILGLNRLWPSNPVNRLYRQLDRDLTHAGEAEQPAGAFLALRRDIWETVGPWDESFFPVWFEDVDYCQRVQQAGFRIAYVPEVRAWHVGGHSVGQLPPSGRARFWYGSLLTYAAKHFSPLGYRGICLAALCSAVPRMFAGIIRERSVAPITTYCEVLWLAGRRLLAPRPVFEKYSRRDERQISN